MEEKQLKKLADPAFHKSLGIELKWRIGDKAGQGLFAIYPYYTPEQCREILDEACGVSGWTVEYREVAEYLFCSIGIWDGDNLIEKSDAGGARRARKSLEGPDKDTFEAKTAASSAFVRAAKVWGIGRHIDLLPQITLKVSGGQAVNPESGELMDTESLIAFCNQSTKAEGYLYAIYRQKMELFDNNERAIQLLKELKEVIS